MPVGGVPQPAEPVDEPSALVVVLHDRPRDAGDARSTRRRRRRARARPAPSSDRSTRTKLLSYRRGKSSVRIAVPNRQGSMRVGGRLRDPAGHRADPREVAIGHAPSLASRYSARSSSSFSRSGSRPRSRASAKVALGPGRRTSRSRAAAPTRRRAPAAARRRRPRAARRRAPPRPVRSSPRGRELVDLLPELRERACPASRHVNPHAGGPALHLRGARERRAASAGMSSSTALRPPVSSAFSFSQFTSTSSGVGDLGVAEHVRVAVDELGDEPVGDVVDVPASFLRGDLRVEGHLEQQVAELVADRGVVVGVDRLEQLVRLLQQVARERARGSARGPTGTRRAREAAPGRGSGRARRRRPARTGPGPSARDARGHGGGARRSPRAVGVGGVADGSVLVMRTTGELLRVEAPEARIDADRARPSIWSRIHPPNWSCWRLLRAAGPCTCVERRDLLVDLPDHVPAVLRLHRLRDLARRERARRGRRTRGRAGRRAPRARRRPASRSGRSRPSSRAPGSPRG